MVNITDLACEVARRAGGDGIAHLFVTGSTAAITTIEFEPGLARDFPAAMERIAPCDAPYAHEERWGDDNGHSHVRASLVGPSLVVPVAGGELVLGTWQQIVLVEFDTRGRDREIIVSVLSTNREP